MITWENPRQEVYRLNCGDMLVLTILRQAPDEWIVTSSHGQPVGVYPTEDAAKLYAKRFAGSMLQKTLGALADLVTDNSATPGGQWEQDSGLNHLLPKGIVVLRVAQHPDLCDEAGNQLPEKVEQAKSLIIKSVQKKIRDLVSELES